ncbi:hypothetical protein [Effusibacillus lacus]|uniref:Acylamide amidohydrolase n=1 Tax=Effusibacillus lacus TaxID=1348429 RepID=A0A292YNK2_9BACL|nr:hypothetical protein [Effusibacillus lacus]TCS70925.1 hypothetical protein EDD64_1291 [Effusibacillus lacus]GAX90040.1 acylamide amidohydrolase [Effusibacillus lacus]
MSTIKTSINSYFGYSNVVNFDGSIIAECDGTPDQVTYALLSISAIRDARMNWTAENHLFNLNHRGYAAYGLAEGDSRCPYDYIYAWANQPENFKDQTEKITRPYPVPSDEKERKYRLIKRRGIQ